MPPVWTATTQQFPHFIGGIAAQAANASADHYQFRVGRTARTALRMAFDLNFSARWLSSSRASALSGASTLC
jgi:hypothetical protein